MRLWRENLLFQFSVTSFVVIALLGVLLSIIIANSVREHAMVEAATETQETLTSLIIHHLAPEDLNQPMTGDRLQSFHSFVTESVVSARTARIKIWNREGRVIYSDDFSQIGKAYPLSHELTEALNGIVAHELSVPQEAENERERLMGTLMEVYVPIIFPGSQEVKGAFEIYRYYAPVAALINHQLRVIFAVASAGFTFLYLALFFIVSNGWRTIRTEQQRVEKAFQEIKALNNLFLGHIQQRQRIIDEIQKLHSKVEQTPQSDEELHRLYDELQRSLKRLAEEASLFPQPPSVLQKQ